MRTLYVNVCNLGDMRGSRVYSLLINICRKTKYQHLYDFYRVSRYCIPNYSGLLRPPPSLCFTLHHSASHYICITLHHSSIFIHHHNHHPSLCTTLHHSASHYITLHHIASASHYISAKGVGISPEAQHNSLEAQHISNEYQLTEDSFTSHCFAFVSQM